MSQDKEKQDVKTAKLLVDSESKNHGIIFLTFILLFLGIFFRFYQIDRKIFSVDECFTSLRVSGYTDEEMVVGAFNNKITGPEGLRKYQSLNPDKSMLDTVKGLVKEEPQLPPLYFMLSRVWAKFSGDSIAERRILSALISILIFPCVFLLCWELFGAGLPGYIATALIAVSPLYVLYAQDARPYSLWVVEVLFLSLLLVKALRSNKILIWFGYSAVLALSFFTYLLTGLVVISHGIFVIIMEKFRLTRRVFAYLIFSFAGFAFFLPWFLYVLHREVRESGLFFNFISLFIAFKTRIQNLGLLFVDTHNQGGILYFGFRNFFTDTFRFCLTGMLVLLVIYAFIFVWRKASKKAALFVLILAGVTLIVLGGPIDFIPHQREARYYFPFYLGVQLALSYLLAVKIAAETASKKKGYLWHFTFFALVILGVISCLVSSGRQVWWNKYTRDNRFNPEIAGIINQAVYPLVISDMEYNRMRVVSFSYLLDPKVKLKLMNKDGAADFPDGFSDIFLYRPSLTLLCEFYDNPDYKLKPVYTEREIWLWKVKKTNKP